MLSSPTKHRIDGGGGVYFTRLSAVGGFPYNFEETSKHALKGFVELIGDLSAQDLLVVDCSFFNPPFDERKTLNEIFRKSESYPTIFLKDCDSEFLTHLGLADWFRLSTVEEDAYRSSLPLIERCYQKHVGSQTSGNYLLPCKEHSSGTVDVGKIKKALTVENAYFNKITEESSGRINSDSAMERLRSTPIKSTRFFDASSILGDPTKYVWVISRLTADFQRLVGIVHSRYKDNEIKLKRMPRLLACTTNGAAIASGIHSFLAPGDEPNDLKLDVIDKLGPTPRMVEEYHGGIKEQDSDGQDWYVYIGDYTIAGTELRIVESYAHYHGVPLMGGLVLGSVLYFLEKNDIPDNLDKDLVVEGRFSVFPLVPLSNLKADYRPQYSFP